MRDPVGWVPVLGELQWFGDHLVSFELNPLHTVKKLGLKFAGQVMGIARNGPPIPTLIAIWLFHQSLQQESKALVNRRQNLQSRSIPDLYTMASFIVVAVLSNSL
jgi:hypothetical protein